MKASWILTLGLCALSVGCTAPSTLTPPVWTVTPARPAATASPTSAPVLPTATQTPPPARTALPLPANATPAEFPQAWAPEGSTVECRQGPGAAFAPTKTFEMAEIVGQERAGNWWFLKIDEKLGRYTLCWVPVETVAASGDLATVPVTEPEAASLTGVSVEIAETETQTVACGPQADPVVFHLTGQIHANGPVKKVKYTWETEAGLKFPPEQVEISTWETPASFEQEIRLPAEAKSYPVTLHAQFPNELVWVGTLTVKCR